MYSPIPYFLFPYKCVSAIFHFSLFTFHYSLFTKEENVTSFLLGFLSPYPYSYIRYSRQDVALHAVADGDVDGVTFHQFYVSDRKLILII